MKRIEAVYKAIRMMEHLGSGPSQQMGVRAIAREVGSSPATVLRILRTLEEAGWVQKDGRGYSLTERVTITTFMGVSWPTDRREAV